MEALIKRLKKEEKLKSQKALVPLPTGKPVRDPNRGRSLPTRSAIKIPRYSQRIKDVQPHSGTSSFVPAYLTNALSVGRQKHLQAFNSFVERIDRGYYHYERRTEWRTCAVAAMTAATHGAHFVERETYNFEEAQYMLSRHMDTDLSTVFVTMNNGTRLPILRAAMSLNDAGWQRRSIATWLHNLV